MRKNFFVTVLLLLGTLLMVAVSASGAATNPVSISESPRLDVMQVVDGEVLDSAVVGSRVVLVGTFTKVRNPGGPEIDQPYIAAYDINSGAFDSGFRPVLNNPAFAVDTDGEDLYIGGNFNFVDGEGHRKVAKLSATGDLDPSFAPQVSANVNDVAIADGRVFLTGRFSSIDGQTRIAFAAVDSLTGELDPNVDFEFGFSVASGGGISGKSIAITPDGSQLFLSHTARFIDGRERTAVAGFDVSANSVSLGDWQTNLYDDELDRFGGALRPRRVAMAPDGSYFVMTTSGGDRPPAGDTAVRFPVDGGANTEAAWVSRHFDTVLGVAISDTAVFVGGHFQFQEAPGSADPFPGDKFTNYGFGFGEGPAQLGSQVVARQQLGALNPETGKSLEWNPGSDSFLGVQSLTFVDGRGLLIGHDGERLGGADIGRHGFFEFGEAEPAPGVASPPADGAYACTSTVDGTTVVLTYSGERGTSENLRQDGRWRQTVTGDSSTQVSNGLGSTFSVRVSGPGFANPFEEIPCNADAAADVEAQVDPVTLDTSISGPASGAVVEPGVITISGDASAPGGIRRVRLTVIRRADSMYLNADGSFTASWARIDVELDTTR